jgi:hypothetical protein
VAAARAVAARLGTGAATQPKGARPGNKTWTQPEAEAAAHVDSLPGTTHAPGTPRGPPLCGQLGVGCVPRGLGGAAGEHCHAELPTSLTLTNHQALE